MNTQNGTCKRRSQIIASPAPPPPTPMHSREVDRQSRTGLIYFISLQSLNLRTLRQLIEQTCKTAVNLDLFVYGG